jgi:adenylate kinase
MGVQGSGKGTQARMLCADLDLVHISVGDIFRWQIQRHTKIGAQVKRIVTAGELVPDELVENVVRMRLEWHDWNYGFVIDGFPRSARQAEFFLESYDIDALIQIELPYSVVEERVLSRRLCEGCGLDYNLIQHRPEVPDTCDVCGGKLVQRADDTPEALRKRLSEYEEKTRPLLELFERKELVVVVDGTKPAEEVQDEIRARLGLPPRRRQADPAPT